MHLLNRSPSPLGAVWRLQHRGDPRGSIPEGAQLGSSTWGLDLTVTVSVGRRGPTQRYPGGRLTASWQNWLRKEEEFQVIKSSILAVLKIPVRHPMKNSSSEWSLNFRREFRRNTCGLRSNQHINGI